MKIVLECVSGVDRKKEVHNADACLRGSCLLFSSHIMTRIF